MVRRVGPGVGVDGRLEERADPSRHLVAALPARACQRGGIRLPEQSSRAVTGRDLFVGQALPGPVVHLPQAGVGVRLAARDDEPRRLDRPPQRARHHAVEVHAGQPTAERGRLRPAGLRERHVQVLAQMLLGRGAGRAPMPRQDHGQHVPSVPAWPRQAVPVATAQVVVRRRRRRSPRLSVAPVVGRPRCRLVLPRLVCADSRWRVVGVVRIVPGGLHRDNGMPDPGAYQSPGHWTTTRRPHLRAPFAACR